MMKNTDKIKELQLIIQREIFPLITSDYVLWGLPYYSNIGDTLIWEGELEFLKSVPYKCVGTCGWNRYSVRPLSKDTVILITGGGYFGDVWRNAWEAVVSTIEHYPDNPIVVLPNTIFYNDKAIMQSDAVRLAKLKNLVICVRDKVSYKIAKDNFENEVRLVPDMAFCMKASYLDQWRRDEIDKVLFLKRIDKELGKSDINIPTSNVEVRDWPTMDAKPTIAERVFGRISYNASVASNRQRAYAPLLRYIEKWYAYLVYRKCMTSRGVAFVSQYKEVYTTRLHVMILSVLLGKKVHFIDNSYGKLSSFYDAWLTDCESVDAYGNTQNGTDI